jgi:16S rRNA (adenine1518-N6/adenine1519-N6)-dimethyltransferase
MERKNTLAGIKNFVPSKKMGQNFLTDDSVAQSIVSLINVGQYDLVIEIGPGTGMLTQYLVQFNRKVIAIELDKRLAEKLHTKLEKYTNLEIINNDILQTDLVKLSADYKEVVLVSNLPYSISTPMMLQFLKQDKIKPFYCMLQKELVNRLIAKPNTKEYGSISVLVQYYAAITKLLEVPPQSFTPAPKVDSNVIVINKLDKHFDSK